jgi:hypothetical protein
MIRWNEDHVASLNPYDDWFVVLHDGTLVSFNDLDVDPGESVIHASYRVLDLPSIDFTVDDWNALRDRLVTRDSRWEQGILGDSEDDGVDKDYLVRNHEEWALNPGRSCYVLDAQASARFLELQDDPTAVFRFDDDFVPSKVIRDPQEALRIFREQGWIPETER